MRIPVALSTVALAAMTLVTITARAAWFYQIVDDNGNTISQPVANYPLPQASFQIDGCREVLSGTVQLPECSGGFIFYGNFIGGRDCGDDLGIPFAEIYSDPVVSACYVP